MVDVRSIWTKKTMLDLSVDLWNSRNLYSGAYIENRNGVASKVTKNLGGWGAYLFSLSRGNKTLTFQRTNKMNRNFVLYCLKPGCNKIFGIRGISGQSSLVFIYSAEPNLRFIFSSYITLYASD